MCLAKVRLNDESGNAFQDIAVLRIEDGIIRLRTLFGEEQEIAGRVKEINFQNSTVILETAALVKSRHFHSQIPYNIREGVIPSSAAER